MQMNLLMTYNFLPWRLFQNYANIWPTNGKHLIDLKKLSRVSLLKVRRKKLERP
jgi:hypothetical protein